MGRQIAPGGRTADRPGRLGAQIVLLDGFYALFSAGKGLRRLVEADRGASRTRRTGSREQWRDQEGLSLGE